MMSLRILGVGVVVLVACVAAMVLLPPAPGPTADQRRAMAELAAIRQALSVYGAQHDGRLPTGPDWALVLVRDGYLPTDLADAVGLGRVPARYLLAPVAGFIEDGQDILAYEDPAFDPSTTVVLIRSDGVWERMSEATLAVELEAQRPAYLPRP